MSSETEEIRKCPFCGGDAEIIFNKFRGRYLIRHFCAFVNTRGGLLFNSYGDALSAWNGKNENRH